MSVGALDQRDNPAGKLSGVDEKNARAFQSMAHLLDLRGQHRLAAFEAGHGAPANAGGIGEIVLRPIQPRSRHSALTLVHGVSFSTKNT